MEDYIISGGVPLRGDICAGGSKNAVLPLLAACVLVQDKVVLVNCPRISDIENMLVLLESLGCSACRQGDSLVIDASMARYHVMPETLSKQMRSSIFMLGPVLARFGNADFTYPGGCEIGLRPIDLHLEGLRKLGAHIDEISGLISCSGKLTAATIHLDYPSVGATENLMMAAVTTKGETIIFNAAREPEVIDLANFLNACGASITGAGTSIIVVSGTQTPLHGCTYTPMPDRIVAGTLLIAGAMTGGDVFVRDARPQDMQAVLAKLAETGCTLTREADGVRLRGTKKLKPIRRLDTQPYPGFPTDMQAQMMALLTLCTGTSVVAENVFESRYAHAGELKRMGADIEVRGRIAVIRGVNRLQGTCVTVKDLRGGAALTLAGIAATGETVVEDVRFIDRGHAAFENMLCALGGRVHRQLHAFT